MEQWNPEVMEDIIKTYLLMVKKHIEQVKNYSELIQVIKCSPQSIFTKDFVFMYRSVRNERTPGFQTESKSPKHNVIEVEPKLEENITETIMQSDNVENTTDDDREKTESVGDENMSEQIEKVQKSDQIEKVKESEQKEKVDKSVNATEESSENTVHSCSCTNIIPDDSLVDILVPKVVAALKLEHYSFNRSKSPARPDSNISSVSNGDQKLNIDNNLIDTSFSGEGIEKFHIKLLKLHLRFVKETADAQSLRSTSNVAALFSVQFAIVCGPATLFNSRIFKTTNFEKRGTKDLIDAGTNFELDFDDATEEIPRINLDMESDSSSDVVRVPFMKIIVYSNIKGKKFMIGNGQVDLWRRIDGDSSFWSPMIDKEVKVQIVPKQQSSNTGSQFSDVIQIEEGSSAQVRCSKEVRM